MVILRGQPPSGDKRLARYRFVAIDDDFQEMIDNDRVFACGRHFLKSEVKVLLGAKMTKRTLVKGSLPKYNMKGMGETDEWETAEASMRPYRSVIQDIELPSEPRVYYNDFEDFTKRTQKLISLEKWSIASYDEGIVFSLPSTELVLPQYQICVDATLSFKKNEAVKRVSQACKLKAPLSATSFERVKLLLQESRLKCSQLEQQLLDGDIVTIIGQHKITPFMNLFWQEQTKLFSRSTKGARFHPAIIRYCLSLYLKSPSVYEEIRKKGGSSDSPVLEHFAITKTLFHKSLDLTNSLLKTGLNIIKFLTGLLKILAQ